MLGLFLFKLGNMILFKINHPKLNIFMKMILLKYFRIRKWLLNVIYLQIEKVFLFVFERHLTNYIFNSLKPMMS